MIAFPAVAALMALVCAAIVGRDAWRRPRPERVIWTIAFLLFAVAAGSEVLGAAAGWTPTLARVYYLSGAVLVVGFLALGELYLLAPRRMPALTPALTLLVAALAVTAVWSAPIDTARLGDEGWDALARGPFLVALAVSLNAGGTVILVGGALHSAWRLRDDAGSRRRAWGCLGLALGAVTVALGGTLTRFGHREYLYLAMALGISIIFAGVLLTRRPVAGETRGAANEPLNELTGATGRASLVPLPPRSGTMRDSRPDAGVLFIAGTLLPLDDAALAAACRRWSASPVEGDILTRTQARRVWALRTLLPDEQKARFDDVPLPVQAQLAELYAEVWSAPAGSPLHRHERRA